MTSINRKQIAKLLALGASPKEVSQEVGISPSHLSQLMAETSFSELLTEMKEVVAIGNELSEDSIPEMEIRNQIHQGMDDLWDELEQLSLSKLMDNVKMGLVTKSGELLQLATLANKATRKKGVTLRDSELPSGNIVQLNISNVLIAKGQTIQTVLNSNNQVIEIAGRTIVNESKDKILARLEALNSAPRHTIGVLKNEPITADDL